MPVVPINHEPSESEHDAVGLTEVICIQAAAYQRGEISAVDFAGYVVAEVDCYANGRIPTLIDC